MGPKNLETILILDENSQDTQTNQNTDTITAESTNAELSHNGVASPKLALVTSNGGAEKQNFSDHHKCAANETSDGGAQRGHRRALKMRALAPVLASHVCLNAGTRAPTRAHSLVITRARKIVTKFHNYSYEIVMSPVIVNSYKNGHNSYQIVK